jgi:predicted ATP-dependent endonuclease of OLD family
MTIQEIEIKNFRLLKDVTLTLDKETTVIVGRNNTGKTSLTELTRRLIGDKSPYFRLEDFSLCVHKDFWTAFQIKNEGGSEEAIRKALPTIEVILKVKYDKDAVDLGALSDFIIDLDPDSEVALISISYRLGDGKIEPFFDELTFVNTGKADFYKALKDRVPSYFHIYLYAVDPTDPTNVKQLEWSRLQAFLKSGFINAQRGLDDETYKDKDVLSKILEVLFNAANSEDATEAEKEIARQLEAVAIGLQSNIETGFNDNLKRFLPALSMFGYPGLNDPGLRTETTIDVARLLKDHTRIRYHGSGDVSLPESFNGLGARNLIYILFKLFEFFKEFQLSIGEPGIQLIFIEEPEAHLHPQMQEVFIRQLSAIIKVFAETYSEGKAWPVQFVLSTHSSHIANEASFDSIRYFITSPISVTDSNKHTRIKDLSTGMAGTPREVREFLHKYMTLTRCDLLFADKAILVEGATERIILPVMIKKNDDGRDSQFCLASQYTTIMEVGGAYAHNFFSLLEFLEIRALIITDLDTTIRTVESTRTTYPKCKVSVGTHTSNATINAWYDIQTTTGAPSASLIAKTQADKTNANMYITYQIPESVAEPCGRSFEAAFILANGLKFPLSGTSFDEREDELWTMTIDIGKTESALKYSIDETDWNIPLYIKQGLDWLAEMPVVPLMETTATSPVVETTSGSTITE